MKLWKVLLATLLVVMMAGSALALGLSTAPNAECSAPNHEQFLEQAGWCPVCQETKETEEPECKHIPGVDTTYETIDATCCKPGKIVETCKCGEVWETIIGPTEKHDKTNPECKLYEEPECEHVPGVDTTYETIDATCCKPGKIVETCKCGEVWETTINPTEKHDKTNPECKLYEKPAEEHKHKYVTKQTIVEPTCCEDGYILDARTCECGDKIENKLPLDKATGKHTYGEGCKEVATECKHEAGDIVDQKINYATCCKNGSIVEKCKCGEVFTTVLDAAGEHDKTNPECKYYEKPEEHKHSWISLKAGEWFCEVCGKFTTTNPNPSDDDADEKKCTFGQHDQMIELGCICPICKECGHTWADGVCKYCGEKSPFSTAPECKHENAHFKQIISDPTCTEDGYIIQGEKYCDECEKFIGLSQIFTNGLEARGHKWADGVCTVCGEKSPFSVAPDTHKCMAETKYVHNKDGKTHDIVCAECGKLWKNEAHNWESLVEGEWFCVDCGKFEYREVVKTKMYYNNTMTSFGPTTRELVGGNDWYRVTPVDLSVDGVYTYDLVASNKYIVGTVTITVNAGALTVEYKAMADVEVKDEVLLVYASKADLTEGKAVTANVGAAINTAETFGEDTKVLVSLILTGDYDAMGKSVIDEAAAAALIANID